MKLHYSLFALIALSLSACVSTTSNEDKPSMSNSATVRFATYNTSLYTEQSGGLIKQLEGDDQQAKKIAAVIQKIRPDVILLNEFDYDEQGRAAELFQKNYLAVGQYGQSAIEYPHRFLAPVNTGVPSGMDLNRDGKIGGEGRSRGDDAFGYGLHPGQYGMLVLSKYPIDKKSARTFQQLLWKNMPNAMLPVLPESGEAWYSDAVLKRFRLSSKSHWDVPIKTPSGVVHLLASHPTPPVFDGKEDRNGKRNHDEIRLWKEYLDAEKSDWLCDDQGRCGGLKADARFLIAGDLNADPADGDSVNGAINQLLNHPRVNANSAPQALGGAELAKTYGIARKGDTRTHTGDFGPRTGTMRLDYVLPSNNLNIHDSGIFWPEKNSADAVFSNASDHRLVWADVVSQ
jgi:endonuclease/exonuclease/phosphatase family metal-dependent hydrolase